MLPLIRSSHDRTPSIAQWDSTYISTAPKCVSQNSFWSLYTTRNGKRGTYYFKPKIPHIGVKMCHKDIIDCNKTIKSKHIATIISFYEIYISLLPSKTIYSKYMANLAPSIEYILMATLNVSYYGFPVVLIKKSMNYDIYPWR